MFKEVLQIIPKLSPGDLSNMERSLGQRFGKIAKKFGQGLKATLLGGGIAGLAMGLIDKLLNPLKETQDAIDRILKQGDDLVTNAKQFGTTAGKLFRLQQLGKSTGLDEANLFMLIEKFQSAVAEAAAEPEKVTAVRNYVGQKDSAQAFFEFIQSLQRMNKDQQVLVQKEVFGEKQILKMADFLQTNFAEQAKALGGPTSAKLTPAIEKVGALSDLKDLLEARRSMNDMMKKSESINVEMVKLQDQAAKLELERENRQIKSYENLAMISNTATQLGNLAKDMLLGINALVVKVADLQNVIKYWSNSRLLKGLLKLTGGGD